MWVAKWMWEIAIYCPFIVFLVSYWFFNHPDSAKTFQTAADVTTPFFMLGVVRAFEVSGQVNSVMTVMMICAAVATIIFFMDWLIQKRVLWRVMIKRIWRAYFLVLTMLYCGVWTFSGVRTAWTYVSNIL